MAGRRSKGLDDSFDLFLDTITNTFGGVLLIALLIVLMIRQNKQSAPQEFQTGPTEDVELVQSAITALELEKKTLAASLQVQQQFSQNFQNEDIQKLAQKLADELTVKNKLEAAAAQLSRTVKQVVESKSGLESEQQQIETDLGAKLAEFEKLNQQLQSEQAARTRTMALPKERESTKREIPMLIEGNQLFVVNKNADAQFRSVNPQHFKKSSSGAADFSISNQFWESIAGAGIAIDSPQLKQELARHGADEYYFAFVVRSDSFESFAAIREACVTSGYEYRLIPTDGIVSDTGGSSRTQ